MILVSLLVKLGTPVLSLALLLATIDTLGSYSAGGIVLSGHALALAGCAPVGGRLADRLGARRTLAGYLIGHALACGPLLTALVLGTPAAALIGTATLLGATTPPVTAIIRGAWPRVVPAASLPTAYAITGGDGTAAFTAAAVAALLGAATVAALRPTVPDTSHAAPAAAAAE
jgi:MFS family permease